MIVKSLIYYPLKSCRGLPLQTAEVDRFGIVGDRERARARDMGDRAATWFSQAAARRVGS